MKANRFTKTILFFVLFFSIIYSFAQDKEKEELLVNKKANNFVYNANELLNKDDFISAEMEYRKAISEKPTLTAGSYNLGNTYYKKGNYEEALYRHQQAAKHATDKLEKHKAFHNIGNILMQNKACKEAVEAYKNALRNNPKDNETRYNLGLAKECEKEQGGDEDNKDNENQKEDKDKKDKDNKQDDKKDDKGNKDKKDGDEEKDDEGKDDEGKPKDEQKDQGKGDKEKQQQKPQQQKGQLSPQQVKNLLEAMSDQEQKVQEKVNAEKQKGVKVKTEKDW